MSFLRRFASIAAVSLAVLVNALHANLGTALQMQLGNPSGATADPASQTKYLIQRAQYALDYNNTTREPNWVAWNLTATDIGSSGRSDFSVDPTLPSGYYQVLTTDYSGSGYDRGHMCPSGDRTVTVADNQVTFYMSNMVPQAPDNNQGVWASFETYCRSLATAGNEVLIISGPSGFAGSTIASGVAIPGYVWKIAVVVPLGSGTAASRITTSTRVIALKIPNIAGIRSNPWQNYITSAAQLESDTGYTFFTDLSPTIRAALRTVVDGQTAAGAPTIVTQPSGQSAPLGGNAAFTVAANGDAPLAYQWLKNDVEIAGATAATLTLSAVTAADAATYTVVVSNAVGTVTSADAALVITGIAPAITSAPAARTVAAGSTVSFSVAASGSPTLTYQWRKGTANLANGGNLSGATTATLTLANVQAADAAADYNVVVTNSVSSATSVNAALVVNPAAPVIVTSPAAQGATTGSPFTLTVVATGTAPLAYQWRKDTVALVDGGNIAGATTASLTVSNAQAADAGSYDVVVTNGVNPAATSAAAAVTVSTASAAATVAWDFAAATPTSGLPADVTGGTVTQNNNNGTTTMISTTSASSGYTGATGTSNAGAAARIGTLNPAAAGSAYFELTLTPAAGKQLNLSALSFGTRSTSTGPQAYSVFTSIDNYAAAVATGAITNNSSWSLKSHTFTNLISTTGSAVTLRLYGHSGTGSPGASTANWRIDDLKITLNTVVAPPTAPALLASTPAASATGVAVTSPITLTFNQAVSVAGSWFSITSALNGAVAATVTGGPSTFTLTPPVSFANSDTVTVTLVASQISDQATGLLRPTSNQTFTFTTVTPIAPTITTAPVAQTVPAGGTATFTVAASGTAPLSYQWRKDTVALTGNPSATSPTLTLSGVQAGDAANYDVVVSNGVNPPATSVPVALTVTPVAPTIATAPKPQIALVGGNATFTVAAAGSTPFTYQWRKGGTALVDGGVVAGATSATLTLTGVALTDAGNYDVVVSNGTAPAAASTPVALTVNPQPANLVAWDFTVATPVAGLPVEVTGGTVTQNNNNGTTTLLTTTSASSGYTGATGTSNAGAAARIGALNPASGGSAYFELTLTPAAGRQIHLLSLAFGSRSTGTGPQAYAVYSSHDNYAAPIATGTFANNSAWALHTPQLTAVLTAAGTPLTLRLFGYNGTGSPGTGTANWRIDDLKVGLTVPLVAPVITTQPVARIDTTAGNPFTLSVTASSSVTPTYQWRKGGTSLSGATAATFSKSDASVADSGNYDVVVTNTAGSVTSSAAVVAIAKGSATIALQNLNQVFDGTPRRISASASPFVPSLVVSYAGSATPPVNAGSYLVTVTADDPNYAGFASATLTVAKAPQTISFGGLSIARITGAPVALSASATSALPVALSVVSGNATLAGGTLTINDTAPVTVRAAQAGDTNYLAAAVETTLTAVAPPKQSQTIAFAALSDRTSASAPFTLAATASSGLPVAFSVVTGPAALANGTVTLAGTAGTVVIRASQAGNTAFNAAPDVERAFAVTLANTAPVITAQPVARTVLVGGNTSFSVTAAGSPAPTYQWRKDGAPITGATGASLALSDVQLAAAGGYDVVVANSVASVTSALARLTVNATPVAPVITRQPGGQVVLLGRPAAFSVVATGAPAPTYQWRKDGTAIAGATGSAFELAAVAAADAGAYSVVVTNSAGTVTSAVARLGVIRRSFAGTYFGTLGGGGTFALQIGADNTGVFLAFAPGSRTAIVSRAVAVDDNGRFTLTGTATTSAAPAPVAAADTPARAAATVDFALEGSISEAGAISASGSGLTLSGAKTADTGNAAASAGFYQAGAAGSSATALVIVAPSGQALVLTQNGATVDGGAGTVDSAGRLSVTTAGTQTIAATLSADSAALNATVTAANGTRTTLTGVASSSSAAAAQRIVNISTRTGAGTGEQVAIVGFVVTGLESKTVLIRAVGPALRAFGVASALAAPRLDLVAQGAAAPLATNLGWSTSPNAAELAHAASVSGAFPLAAGSADSVILATLAPGAYTAVVGASDGRAGVGLVEVYDLSGGSGAQRLANLSTRALTGTGDNTLIAGLVVAGTAPKRVLLRAAGPALAAFGVAGTLGRPALALYSGTTVVAENQGWSTSPDAAAIADAAGRTGAFAFAAGSLDAALIVNLAPGAYTAQVTGVAGAAGIALVEVYELP